MTGEAKSKLQLMVMVICFCLYRLPEMCLSKCIIRVPQNDDDSNIEVPVDMQAEEESVRNRVLTELLTETIENEGELYGNENSIVKSLNLAYDKAILKLIAVACSNQETEKALSLVQELKQDAALNAAAKIAQRAEMMTLMRKINEIREVRFEREMGNI